MPRQFETQSDQALTAVVKDALDWDHKGTLPDGILRIEADRLKETYPTMDVADARKITRQAAYEEAAIRWMETQGFQV